jgi:hypothetical protein
MPTPSNPSPADGATGVNISPTITWSAPGASACTVFVGVRRTEMFRTGVGLITWPISTRTGQGVDDGNGNFTFDVHDGLRPPTPIAQLRGGTTFYWQVFADGVPGPIWKFTTAADPAAIPSNPSPADAGTASLTPELSWSAAGGTTTYDVYFGTTDPPPLVSSGQGYRTYRPGTLVDATTYYWKIVAHAPALQVVEDIISDPDAATGSVWSFAASAAVEDDDVMILDKDLTTHDVVNTTSTTTTDSFTVPGGTLDVDRALRITVIGDYLNNTGSAQTLLAEILFGGSAAVSLVAGSVAASASRRGLFMQAIISAKGATNAQAAGAHAGLDGGGSYIATDFGGKTLAIDSTSDQTLLVHLGHGAANSSLSARTLAVWVEKL